eukprot:GHVS01065582.1.p1 GENE.GHVS01065582.1~~GHVS01065582.1.p1  ORF type:complete len:785 (+),score=89.34 GHVS01065582.1:304-2658(+)
MGSPITTTLVHPLDDVVKLCVSLPQPAAKCVLIVGAATSFLGPFLVAAILREDRRIVVCCLVDVDEETGVKEIQRVCSSCCCWEESFLPRFIARAGDPSLRFLGMEEKEYVALKGEVDMVVCVGDGGDGGLALYSEARQRLVLPLTNVLHFCNASNCKPLHYLSSLQQFPCLFSSSSSTILENSTPDIREMTADFSTETLGTNWAFWAAEQLLQRGHTALHVYRLPDVFLAGMSGLMRTDHFATAFLAAMVQEGKMPKGALPITITPADALCELLAKLVLKPNRKNSMYHLQDNRVLSGEDLSHWAREVALFCELVDVADFIATIRTRGEKSPLFKFLPLLQRQNCWFGHKIKSLQVDDSNVWDDLPKLCPFTWPHPRPNLEASFQRCVTSGIFDETPRAIVMDADRLFDDACRLAGCSEMDDKAFFLDGARKLLHSVGSEIGSTLCEKQANSYFTRLSLAQALLMDKRSKEDPSIELAPIRHPIIIVGHSRSGSTFFQQLLSRDPQLRSPLMFEQRCPIAVPENRMKDSSYFPREEIVDARISCTKRGRIMSASHDFMRLHEVHVDSPDEVSSIAERCFRYPWFRTFHNNSSYIQWLFGNDQAEIRNFSPYVKRTLQHLQQPGDQWLVKWISGRFEDMLATFPDIRTVCLHRDTKKRVASMVELVYAFCENRVVNPDKLMIGKEVLLLLSAKTRNMVEFRKTHPEQDIYDIQFDDMVADPIGTVKKMYAHFGMTLSEEAQTLMELFGAEEAAKKKTSPGKHGKLLKDFGLTEKDIEDAFAGCY